MPKRSPLVMEGALGYREILVFLDASPDNDARLVVAIALARQHEARLIGVDVSPPSAFEGRWGDRARRIQDDFANQLKQSALDGEYLIAGTGAADWKDYYAHYADLVVATQRDDSNADVIPARVPDDVLLSAGVPMLILPFAWRPAPFGESVVLAWNPSREATRAVHDAMPILAHAKKVTVFAFAPRTDAMESDPELLACHLRRHGVSSDVYTWPVTGDISAVEALFACLDMHDADLIVAGAYGHSRWFEGLFGGMSRALLRQPVMPVLLSH